MFICGLCILAALGLVLILILIFSRCDGDFTVLWKEKFGHKIGSLSGQVVWITGASSGTGEAMAHILAQAGCKLVLSARRGEELKRVKTACLKTGKLADDDVLVLPFDITDFESHTTIVQRVLDHFQKIDILINTAGTAQQASWLDVSLEVDKAVFELNVLGPVSLTQQVLPHMIARSKGQVVVTGSLSGKFGSPGSRSCTGNRFTVHGYFECLRAEVRHQNIGVTLISPCPVFSNILVNSLQAKAGELLGNRLALTGKRVETDRCAYLSCVAIANRLCQVWISRHPFLLVTYMSQYIPDFGRWYGLHEMFSSNDSDEKELFKHSDFSHSREMEPRQHSYSETSQR